MKVHDGNDIPKRVLEKAGYNEWYPHQEEIIQKLLESDIRGPFKKVSKR
jgi:hypothetical protein